MNQSRARSRTQAQRSSKSARLIYYPAITLAACLFLAGCTTRDVPSVPEATNGPIVQAPANFEAALRQNKAALGERKGPQDLALFNIGVILAHPANPRRDQARAVQSFRTLVMEHPHSTYVEQAKTWMHVLEQQQKIAEERLKLAEERRALNREKEMLAQERQKINYASEKSQQLDLEIEKRRRQSLGR
jgi:hypothetical protein